MIAECHSALKYQKRMSTWTSAMLRVFRVRRGVPQLGLPVALADWYDSKVTLTERRQLVEQPSGIFSTFHPTICKSVLIRRSPSPPSAMDWRGRVVVNRQSMDNDRAFSITIHWDGMLSTAFAGRIRGGRQRAVSIHY